jgi:ABC-type multidrug transport system fused ATPase/permease subunit
MKMPPLLGGRRRTFLVRLVANGLVQAVATLGLAFFVSRAFDAMLVDGTATQSSRFWMTIGTGLVLIGILAGLRRREVIDGEMLAQYYAHRVRRAMYRRLYTRGSPELRRLGRGAVLLRFLGDLTSLTQWVGQGYARLLVGAVMAGITLSVLAVVEWRLASLVAAVLIVGVLATLALGPRLDASVRAARERRTVLASHVAERLGSLAVVQAFAQAGREQRRLRRQSRELRTALIARAIPAASMAAVAELTGGVAMLLALAGGALVAVAGGISLGTVLAVVTLTGLLSAPVRDLGRAYELWIRAQISGEKIGRFLAGAGRDRARQLALTDGPGRLELCDLRWGEVLRGVTGQAPARARIALLGDAGAGKSALLCVVAGLVDADQGTVALDGQDLATADPAALRRAIGIVSGELPLMRGTVAQNLRYAAPDAAPETVARVSMLCRLDELLRALPDGAATRLVDGGSNLSAGQRQRVALVRALLTEPRLLLLDDVDIALDPAQRRVLSDLLRGFRGTILMVTRDAELLAQATRVWELRDGQLLDLPGPAAGGSVTRAFPRSAQQR